MTEAGRHDGGGVSESIAPRITKCYLVAHLVVQNYDYHHYCNCQYSPLRYNNQSNKILLCLWFPNSPNLVMGGGKVNLLMVGKVL